MQIVIDIDENVFTRLFDNGTDFYDTDDILAMAKAIRKGTPLSKVIEKFKEEVENKYDDFANSWDENARGKNEMVNEVLEMLDELIESEGTDADSN